MGYQGVPESFSQSQPQYKASHMGMTDEEERNMVSQQSGYDYVKQKQLAAMGVGGRSRNPSTGQPTFY